MAQPPKSNIMRRPEELLYDSEACLRLIDHVIEELGSPRPETTELALNSSVSELAEQPAGAGDTDVSPIKGGGQAHHRVTR